MPLDILHISRPFEIAWSQNEMIHSFAIAPYNLPERNRNLYIRVQVLVETTWLSDVFEQIAEQVFYPNSNGLIHLDIATYIDPYLDYLLPAFTLRQPVECEYQTRRYQLHYTLTDDFGVVVPTQISDAQVAIKGGLPYEFLQHRPFFESGSGLLSNTIIEETTQFATIYRTQERLFLFYLSKNDISITGKHAIELYNTQNQKIAHHDFTIASLKKWRVYCIPLSPDTLMPQVNTADIFYMKYVAEDLNSKIVRFNTDPRKFYHTHSLMYRNSMGGIDPITLRGQADYELDYARQILEQVTFPDITQGGYLKPRQQQNIVEEQYYTKADTGFVTKERIDALRDLWLSEEAYEYKAGKLLPIVISNNKVKLYNNRQNLFSAIVEFQQAWTNRHYAQPGIEANLAHACPPVLYLALKQVSRGLLEIFWGLQMPYDIIEIEVVYGGSPASSAIFTFTGNTGRREISIINPSQLSITVTVQARTICDANSNPISASAWLTRTIDVEGRLPPVAVDDNFTITSGHTAPLALSGSILANDYDPDGDAIEVVAASGSTNQGGTFVINAAGEVTYTPPSGAFTGMDYFDYTVTETAGLDPLSDTARVYINVNEPNVVPNVFVKMIERNVITENRGAYVRGERWAYFYTDAAGTIPINVTGRQPAIVLNIEQHHLYTSRLLHDPIDDTTVTQVPGSSYSIQFYSGLFRRRNGEDDLETYKHKILPGTGYTVI